MPNQPYIPVFRTKRLITILIIIIVSLAILWGIFLSIALALFYNSQGEPVNAIKQQLALLNEGKTQEAYNKFASGAFKKRTSFEDFKKLVDGNPQIFKSKDTDFNRVIISGKQAEASGTITGFNGTVTPVTYNLVFENGQWRILGFRQGAEINKGN